MNMQSIKQRIMQSFGLSSAHLRSEADVPPPICRQLSPEQVEVYETTPILPRSSDILKPRLNLLLPALAKDHVFGGIMTALQLFLALAKDDIDVRIILSDQADCAGMDIDMLRAWKAASADSPDQHGRIVVPFGDRGHRTIPVRKTDIFFATAWWTAYVAQRLIGRQAECYAHPRQPLIYLVQDHEPGFYAWSTRYYLAQSTYQYNGPMIGIFNTKLLLTYFQQQGYRFSSAYHFEPQLNTTLQRTRLQLTETVKKRVFSFYGRPGVARNAFELAFQGVRTWTKIDPSATDWTIYSIGEKHSDINLHNGCKIVSLGKLTLDQYTDILQQSAIGLSLMFSPHPSYPPLEMAEFGVQTITNTFANKNLSILSPFIHSLDSPTPENIAELIKQFAAAYATQPTQTVTLPEQSIFAPPGKAYPFIDELRVKLQLTN